MNTIKIDFGNIVNELRDNDLFIFFRKNVYGNTIGIFIQDNNNNVYQIEDCRHGSYLDKLIKNKTIVKFNKVDYNIIEEWEKIFGIVQM